MKGVSKKQHAYKQGVQAEKVAALYLKARGYEVLEVRYKTPVGEIDLILRHKNCLVFAEVKSHRNEEQALFAVTQRSRRRIEAAAEHYISYHEDVVDCEMRFDVLIVPPDVLKKTSNLTSNLTCNLLGAFSVRHLDNAWMCGQ